MRFAATTTALGLLSAPALSEGSTRQNAVHCCQRLYKLYPGQLFLPSSNSYTNLDQRWSDAARLGPSCIFQPASADDVSVALQIFTASSCLFAAKSGGGAPNPGDNDIDQGITVDMGQLNSIDITAGGNIVRAGTATNYNQILRRLDETDVTIPGACCNWVATGGLALTGGISMLSSRAGFVADSVVNFEVVTGTGRIINANSTDNSDLFVALKGGGNNFGMVTRFDFATLHKTDIWGGKIFYAPEASDSVLEILSGFPKANAKDPASGVRLEFSITNTTRHTQVASYVWNTKGLQKPPSLLPFCQIKPQLASRLYSSSLLDWISHSSPEQSEHPIRRSMFATVTIVNDENIIKAINRWTKSLFDRHSDFADVKWQWSFDPLPGFYREDHGKNAMGLDDTRSDLIIVLLSPTWLAASYDNHMRTTLKLWVGEVDRIAKAANLSHPFKHMGYAAPFQDPLAGYGARNWQMLRDVALKYDPQGVFQKLMPGGFKISASARPMKGLSGRDEDKDSTWHYYESNSVEVF